MLERSHSVIKLDSAASVSAALNDTGLDADSRALLGRRCWDLYALAAQPSGIDLLIVQGGDTPDVINAAALMQLTGDGAEPPAVDWIRRYDFHFEVVIKRDDGRSLRLLVEDGPATELGIHYLCLTAAETWR